VNYDLPHEPETYVHRIGRTGRAGSTGFAVAFCDEEERQHLRAIERLTRQTLSVETIGAFGPPTVQSYSSVRKDVQPYHDSHARHGSHPNKSKRTASTPPWARTSKRPTKKFRRPAAANDRSN
jgi:ATP-dependent RNA helicase RhlE